MKDAHYCNGCGVDLFEGKEQTRVIPKRTTTISNMDQDNAKKEDLLAVVHWCTIKTIDLFPSIFLVAMLIKGRSKLGFCDCPICNQGYRELLAELKRQGGEKISANSREIVKEVYGKDLSKIQLDLSDIFQEFIQKQPKSSEALKDKPRHSDAILIEIPKEVIETTIEKVLSGEKGQQIIKQALRKPRKSIIKQVKGDTTTESPST